MSFAEASFTEAAGRLMALAALLLGWRPAEFWAATPDELGAILQVLAGGSGDASGLDAADLTRLKEIWPDDG